MAPRWTKIGRGCFFQAESWSGRIGARRRALPAAQEAAAVLDAQQLLARETGVSGDRDALPAELVEERQLAYQIVGL